MGSREVLQPRAKRMVNHGITLHTLNSHLQALPPVETKAPNMVDGMAHPSGAPSASVIEKTVTSVCPRDDDFAVHQQNLSLRVEDTETLLGALTRRLEVLESTVQSWSGEVAVRRSLAASSTEAGEAKVDRCPASAPSHDDGAHFEGYTLGESVWDAALLVGLSESGFLGSASIVTSLLLNMIVQVLFCVVAFTSLTETSFPTVPEIMKWREATAHDVTWSDADGASLASRVCGGDASLAVSTGHMNLVEEIDLYVASLDLFPMDLPQGCVHSCVHPLRPVCKHSSSSGLWLMLRLDMFDRNCQ